MPHRASQPQPSSGELKLYRSLVQKKFREKQRLYLIEGVRLCEELLQSRIAVRTFLCTEEFGASDQRQQRLMQAIKASRIPCSRISGRQFEEISTTEHSQGIAAVADYHDQPADALLEKLTGSPVVLLDRISDPGNLGTIIRTCAWFGAAAVFISGASVEPYNPKVVRATMGGIFKVPFSTGVRLADAISDLKKRGYAVYATQLSEAEPVSKISFPAKYALLFGNESEGIDPSLSSLADHRVMIPGANVESLSVGVAVGIVLSHAVK